MIATTLYRRGGNVAVNAYSLFRTPPRQPRVDAIILCGWDVFSPAALASRKNIGIPFPLQAFSEGRRNFYLVHREYPELLVKYLKEQYNPDIQCHLWKNLYDCPVWKFEKN